MKKIVRIAKIELSTLFYSPIAWLLFIVFFIQTALTYYEYMQIYVTYQELGGEYKNELFFLTARIFGDPTGMSRAIEYNLYLYIPLLTMGLISRELSSGTIKLLYSSPIQTRDIVLGKYLAIVVYCLLLTFLAGVFFLTGCYQVEHADKGLLLSISLGVFILLSAYSAIGLFVSSLTSYQVVAAISTFVLFASLNYIGSLWQDKDFFRDIANSISLNGRTFNINNGLITTKDLFYFAVIIYIFISLSILRLESARSAGSKWIKAGKYTAVVLSGLTIGYITSRPTLTGYLDLTTAKTQTLTKASQKILGEMDKGPLEITSYINLLDDRMWLGTPVQRNTDVARWLPYIRFKPDIKLKYVYYYDSISNPDFYKGYPGKNLDEIAATYIKSMRLDKDIFKKPAEIRKIINLHNEENRYVMRLKYNGKSTFLRLYDDVQVFPSERETDAALKRLVVKVPKIAFLEGELERNATRAGDKDYKRLTSEISFRYAMVNQGFDFTTLSLKTQDIPPDVSALVIADPKAPFDSAALIKIEKFIDDGGNLLIAGEPGKQSVLNALLRRLGVQMTDGMIVQKSSDYAPSFVLPYMTPAVENLSSTLTESFTDSMPVSMPSVAGLDYEKDGPFTIQPLLMTDERKAWQKMGALSSDSVQVSFMPADGDQHGKFPTMLALTRKMKNGKEQHIIVSGDADFMSTAEMKRGDPHTSNFNLNTALFGWLSNGEFPVDVTRPDSKDIYLRLTNDNISVWKIVYVWVIPALLFIIGTVLLVRRKRQ